MSKIIISTDNCADLFKSDMKKKNIYCLPLKRISNGTVHAEICDSEQELDAFYDEIKKGILSSTSQINPEEFTEYFRSVFEKEKEGDIIHLSLSGGLSGSHNSAVIAAEEINKTMKNRRVYPVDTLSGSGGMIMLADRLLQLRDGTNAQDAVKIIENIRDNQHALFIVDDLKHLRRGGRLSAAKAFIGSILGIKPILLLNKNGKIAIKDKVRGTAKAMNHILELAKIHASADYPNHENKTLYLLRTSKSENFETFKKLAHEKFPQAKIQEVPVGPVLGTHLGCGAMALIFQGAPRLDIS